MNKAELLRAKKSFKKQLSQGSLVKRNGSTNSYTKANCESDRDIDGDETSPHHDAPPALKKAQKSLKMEELDLEILNKTDSTTNNKEPAKVSLDEILDKRLFWIKPFRTIACFSLYDVTMVAILIDFFAAASVFLWFDYEFFGPWGIVRGVIQILSSLAGVYVVGYNRFTGNRTDSSVYIALEVIKAVTVVVTVVGVFILCEELGNGKRCQRYSDADVGMCFLGFLIGLMILICDCAFHFFIFFILYSVVEWIRAGREDLILTNLVAVGSIQPHQSTRH